MAAETMKVKKKKDTDIPDCERDHYDSVRDHHAVSCIKYISNIFK